jgi:hypothetical protein
LVRAVLLRGAAHAVVHLKDAAAFRFFAPAFYRPASLFDASCPNLIKVPRFAKRGIVGRDAPHFHVPVFGKHGVERLCVQQEYMMKERIGTGQCNVKAHNRQLCDLIHAGRAKPSFIVSHELGLSKAPDAYQHFDARDQGWTKVILKPAP